MNRAALLVAAGVVTIGAVATPAIAGLFENPSFSHRIPVPTAPGASITTVVGDRPPPPRSTAHPPTAHPPTPHPPASHPPAPPTRARPTWVPSPRPSGEDRFHREDRGRDRDRGKDGGRDRGRAPEPSRGGGRGKGG